MVLAEEIIKFTDEEREAWRIPSKGRLFMDLCLPWLQAAVGAAIFIANPSALTWLVAVLFISGAQHGLSLISHEAAHRLIWPADKRVNDFIATYFFAAPSALPFNVYRQRHLLHHRLVSKVGDTKSYYLRDLRGPRLLWEVLRGILGIDYLVQAKTALESGKDDEQYENFDENLSRDKRSLIITHLVLLGVFTAFDPMHYGIPTYYVILWLGPLFTTVVLLSKLRSIVEHQPPNFGYDATKPTPYFKNTPGPMLRSVRATWLERFFLSKINFHYHGEHHLWPWISYQYLPEVNRKLWQDKALGKLRIINGNLVACDTSYLSVIWKLVRAR